MKAGRIFALPGFIFATLGVTLSAACAEPGIVIHAEERLASDEDGKVRESRIQIAEGKLRMDNVRGNDVGAVIYDRAAGQFLLLDKQKKTYRVLPKAALETAFNRLNQAVQLARERINDLSAENRDQIAALLDAGVRALDKKVGEGGPTLVYQHTDRTDKVGLWTARIYEGVSEGKKQVELFVANTEDIALAPEHLALLAEVRGVFDSALGQVTGIKVSSALFPAPGSGQPGDYRGFPVRRIRYHNNVAAADWRLARIVEEDFPEDIFLPPDDYEQRAISLEDLKF